MKYIIIFFFAITLNSQDIYRDLVAYYPMNCNSLDSSGNNIHGVIQSSPECIEGKLFEALRFNGTDDYVEIPKSESNKLISSKGFTWSLWIRSSNIPQSNQPGRSRTFISAASPADAEDIYIGFGSLSTSRNEISFVVDGPGGAGASAAANNAILTWKPTDGYQEDEWYHIVGIRDYENRTVKLYVNGNLVRQATITADPFVNPLDFSVARFSDGSSDIGSYYDGDIDEVRIYDRVITDQEILILYSARPEQIEVVDVNIDFDNIKCKSDSVIIVNLLNVGPSDFIIADTELYQNKEFSILNGGEIFLQDQEVYSLGIKFEPNEEGEFYDTLYLKNNFGVQPLILYLSGRKYVEIEVEDTLRFLELVDCMDNNFTQRTLKIVNNNIDDGLEISSIEMRSVFTTSSTFPIIELGDTLDLELTYTPDEFGFFSDTAIVNFTNCNQSRTFTILSRYTKRNSDKEQFVDFGASENGLLSSRTYSIENTGTTSFDIYYVEFKENTQFTLLTDPNDFIISVPREQSRQIEIGFTPTGGLARDTMYIISYSLCGEKIDTIPLSGVGRYRAIVDISVESQQVELNDKITIPIKLTNIRDLELAEIDSLVVDFEVNNSSIIVNDEEIIGQVSEFKSFRKTIAIDKVDEQTVNLFDAEIVLGNSSSPKISIISVTPVDGLMTFTSQNGEIDITNICEAGEIKRLFMSSFWFFVSEPSPNPVNDYFNLNFELIEEGATKINIYNQQGELVKVLFDNEVQPGNYNSRFIVSDLQTGVYFINIVTPSHNITKKLIKQ